MRYYHGKNIQSFSLKSLNHDIFKSFQSRSQFHMKLILANFILSHLVCPKNN